LTTQVERRWMSSARANCVVVVTVVSPSAFTKSIAERALHRQRARVLVRVIVAAPWVVRSAIAPMPLGCLDLS